MLTLLTELEAGSLWNCSCNLLGLLHCGKKDGREVRSRGGRGPHETEGAPRQRILELSEPGFKACPAPFQLCGFSAA